MDIPVTSSVKTWCKQAAEGDSCALERLLTAHHRRMLGFARRKVDPRWQGRIEPEDVLQEAYVEAFTAIGGFECRGEDAFFYWMARIIENRFYYHVRRLRAVKRDVSCEQSTDRSTAYLDLLANCLRDQTSPSGAALREEAHGALMACLARLPETHREVIRRRYLQGQSFTSIAAELERTEDAVRRLAGRALERLSACMGHASQFLSASG